MRFDAADMPDLLVRLTELAGRNRYSKIICKILAPSMSRNLRCTALRKRPKSRATTTVGKTVFSSHFSQSPHGNTRLKVKNQRNSRPLCISIEARKGTPVLPLDDFSAGIMSEKHADEMAAVYREVFESYPFPITEAEYIRSNDPRQCHLFGIRHHDRLVALSLDQRPRTKRKTAK